ncbi:leucyl/phenylalanyl-tRNA--protein transferase [Marinicellulosiphila megalodicopiae]|uniref:leucyl/phenylalanyl-tRNA--protein transferase n=1 Tax=Marinicellulosiphila megalodicopiae TaxID=2724896 RepID=UPI003BAF0FC8
MINIAQLSLTNLEFPPTSLALSEPDGLLCFGGDLSPQRLLNAYKKGIFPWFSPEEPILWWTPNPRTVCLPCDMHISKSLKKSAKKVDYTIKWDTAFEEVIQYCCDLREDNTWISPDIIDAYTELHKLGHAHSVEVWQDNLLIGGLYGLHIGGVFFGESMFSLQTNASKYAFVGLCKLCKTLGIELIDGQVENDYLNSLGFVQISRNLFENQINTLTNHKKRPWPEAFLTVNECFI